MTEVFRALIEHNPALADFMTIYMALIGSVLSIAHWVIIPLVRIVKPVASIGATGSNEGDA
jgi:hypothetical protein